MSDNTKTFYGRSPGAVEERYLAHIFGAFRACVEEHLPVTVINDWNLNDEDLARYRVLILPNTACVDDRQAKAIAKFVEQGGGLIASLDVSLFDEYGDARSDFALKEVFGVSHRGAPAMAAVKEELDVNFAKALTPEYWQKRKGVFDFKQDVASWLNIGKMKTYVGPQSVTFKGPAVQVKLEDAQAKVIGTLMPRGEGAKELPAVITRSHGQGRVVYLASGLDAAYYSYAYPYQRVALANALRWAAASDPPVTVAAPMCVHASLLRQSKDGERLLLHLFNDVNTTAFHALPIDDVPLREETLPIHDITITFAPQYQIKRVHLEPEGKALEIVQEQGSRVTVPKLEIHSIVVAELE
jgi:type 1 glutamine amidotransferase